MANLESEIEQTSNAYARTVLSMRWVSLIIVYLGMMMVNQFFAQISWGRLRPSGFEVYMEGLALNANVDRVTRSILEFMGDNGQIFAPLFAVFVAVVGVMAMLLVWRSVAAFAISIFFWGLWYATSTTSGIWTWEYLFPAIFALLAGFATLPQFAGNARTLGYKALGKLTQVAWIVISLVLCVILWWFFTLSNNGGPENNTTVSLVSAIVLVVLLLITGRMDGRRAEGSPPATGFMQTLERTPWVAIMIVVTGAMMAIQVFADIAVGWYDVEGYQAIVRQYADSTAAPGWWSAFLEFVADHPRFFMPIQAVAEFACAFFLITLLIRPITLFATFGFFFTLMFSEFGVSATIKQGSDTTWTWEMLFLTGVILMLAFATLGRTIEQATWKERLLGDKFFNKMPLVGQFVVAVVGAALLWAAGIQTRMFGSEYETTSLRGALFFLGCFIVLIIVDHFREELPWSDREQQIWIT